MSRRHLGHPGEDLAGVGAVRQRQGQACGVQFGEGVDERIGVILERDDAAAAFGAGTWALFLRNLVTQLGQPDLVDYVEAGDGAAASDGIRADYPAARLRWSHGGLVDVYPGLG
ncbi:hypothetical protein AB0O91_26635 [Kitasatospora sp. NPDC089797]|uniref:hypothetical protein n=1 Tax=Kitasatospora sp. NPDC089797 TaxID=3155298 RepID=UPI00341C2146